MWPLKHAHLGFTAELGPEALMVRVGAVESLTATELMTLAQRFNRYGAAVLVPERSTGARQEIQSLGKHFGAVVGHDRADSTGIIPIDGSLNVPGYLGSLPLAHPLHTDGAFARFPEKVMTLQCIVQATEGGLSMLASAKAALDYLLNLDPRLVEPLFRADAMTISRNAASCTRPVLRWLDGRLSMVYRWDDTAITRLHPAAEAGFRALSRFLADPANVLTFSLQPHWILVVDNTAVVHGRTAFPPGVSRIMNRLNFAGPTDSTSLFELGFMPEPEMLSRVRGWAHHDVPVPGPLRPGLGMPDYRELSAFV